MRRLLFFVTLDMWGCCAMSLHNHKGRADLHRNNCSTFQIFTFPPFYMPTAMSIIQFRPLVCCECCGCLEDTFTCFCLWFEMTALRFWFSFLGRWKICCSLLCVTGKKVSGIDSQRISIGMHDGLRLWTVESGAAKTTILIKTFA